MHIVFGYVGKADIHKFVSWINLSDIDTHRLRLEEAAVPAVENVDFRVRQSGVVRLVHVAVLASKKPAPWERNNEKSEKCEMLDMTFYAFGWLYQMFSVL